MANRLIFVTYKGGNCGDFFCSLLDKALGNQNTSFQDETNRCNYGNPAYIDHGIKGLEEVFRRYNKHKYITAVDQMNDKTGLEHLEWTKRIHDFCYDEDRHEFIKNVRQYISSNLIVNSANTVASIHYYDDFDGFKLTDVYDPSIVFQLMTSNPLHHSYFFYLARYKQRFALIKNSPDWYDFKEDAPMVKELRDNVTVIDSGKFFLTSTYDDEMESIVSNRLGFEVRFDKDLLNKYRRDNEKIMTDSFGKNYRDMSLDEFRQKRKKIFERMRSL